VAGEWKKKERENPKVFKGAKVLISRQRAEIQSYLGPLKSALPELIALLLIKRLFNPDLKLD
jgi:hypothetical protein